MSTKVRKKSNYANSEYENNKNKKQLLPKNENQRLYIDSIINYPQTIVTGPAGTGKTFIAATMAANMYLSKDIDKIILTRPNISAGKSIGFFPGTLEEKMDPWMKPITKIIQDIIGKNKFENDLKKENIEIVPFETMRGRNFDNSFIILDEAQNTTLHELKMFLTRTGENSRVILNGDVRQTDLHENSGLAKIIHIAKSHYIECGIIEFDIDDIVRSDITKEWIMAFDEEGV